LKIYEIQFNNKLEEKEDDVVEKIVSFFFFFCLKTIWSDNSVAKTTASTTLRALESFGQVLILIEQIFN